MIVTYDGNLRLEGEIINPHSASLSGLRAYYIDNDTRRALEIQINGRDRCYLSSDKAEPSFTFMSENKGHFRVMSAGVWTDADTEQTATADLEYLQQAIEEEGWKWADTASSLSGRICREYVDIKQLPPRWRQMAHSAIHQGPMVCLMGGADMAIAWDREKAFLRALYEPVPTGTWTAIHPASFRSIKGMQGIVRATVRVSPTLYTGRVPALPVRFHGYTVYPVGLVHGTWTLSMFNDAIENGGYEIVEIHELMVCQALPIHARAAERIERVADKRLRKLLYTRYWGRLAATGGFEGYRDERFNGPKKVIWSGLKWYYMGISPTSHSAPPDYRPDHAAFIASTNHLVMNQALRKYDVDRIIATHVDCIWVNDLDVPPFDTFREKHRGEARFYGVGCYRVGDCFAAQGFKGQLSVDTLEQWGSQLASGDKLYRRWHFNGPNERQDATSDPPLHDTRIAAYTPVSNLPGDIYWEGWTAKGWLHKEKEEQ